MKNEETLIGWAMEDITPEGAVFLLGQYYERKSQYVETNLKATAFAMEQKTGTGKAEQVIMVSLDVLWITASLQQAVREKLAGRLSGFDDKKLFLNATHTHSAPDPDPLSGYGKWLVEKLALVIINAWENRKPAGISRALAYAVTGHNRRVKYADGTVEMYGAVSRPDFTGLEGSADPGVGCIFCWSPEKELTGIIMNVACPAQVTESKYYVSADFWGHFRDMLSIKFAKNVFVLAQCGAAGDLSPRDLPRDYKAGEPDMWDVPGAIEIARRLLHAIEMVYPSAAEKIDTAPIFHHLVTDIDIPARIVSETEYQEALQTSEAILAEEPADPSSPATAWNRFLQEIRENEKHLAYGPWDNKKSDYGVLRKKLATVEQYRNQENFRHYTMELHVLRLGDAAIASNSFELFVDYGFSITGRSKAAQTFLVQLSCDYGDYLATQAALQGGGYSAMANPVGPEGGWFLADQTVAMINSLWP